MIKLFCLFISILSFVFTGCTEAPVPKPSGFNRIEKPTHPTKDISIGNITATLSDITVIDSLSKDKPNELWFNISYPHYGATIYCTYLPVSPQNYITAIEDSYHLAYSHSLKADGINQLLYNRNNLGGIIYEIEGDVATPFQFFITDSTSHFLRGSLYYNEKVNTDSVSPITEFIKDDIKTMFGTITFDSKK